MTERRFLMIYREQQKLHACMYHGNLPYRIGPTSWRPKRPADVVFTCELLASDCWKPLDLLLGEYNEAMELGGYPPWPAIIPPPPKKDETVTGRGWREEPFRTGQLPLPPKWDLRLPGVSPEVAAIRKSIAHNFRK